MKVSGSLLVLALLSFVLPAHTQSSDTPVPVQTETIEITVSGNHAVSSTDIIDNFKSCGGDLWKKYDPRAYEYLSQKCSRELMFSRGFWRAKIVEMTSELTGGVRNVTVVVSEGPRYRLGQITFEGNTMFSSDDLIRMLGQRTGDIADGKAFPTLIYETLKNKYHDLGYVLYSAEFDPDFIEPGRTGVDGVVDVSIKIDEGRKYKVGLVTIKGMRVREREWVEGAFSLRPGEVFSPQRLKDAVTRFNELGRFKELDADRDISVFTDEETAEVDLLIELKKLEP